MLTAKATLCLSRDFSVLGTDDHRASANSVILSQLRVGLAWSRG